MASQKSPNFLKSLKYGDSPEVHSQKVDKLKLLSESLVRSANKAEKEISDDRIQKEEALKFRVAKTSEVGEIEKELAAEISALEKQRNEIEAQLKQVNISLAAASARLHNAREERDQFYDANDQIVAHLKTREGELSKTIGSCRVEEHVVSSWIKFLEDAWVLQSSYTETKDKEAKVELEKHEDYFVNLVLQLLSDYEKELRPSIDRIRKYVENLKSLGEGSAKEAGLSSGESKALSPRKSLELEYLDYEAKIITTFSVVDNMMEQFYAQHGKVSRKDDPKIKGLFENIEKLREEFESIERPELEMEIPDAPTQEGDASSHNIPDENKSDPARKATEAPETGTNEENKPPSTKAENVSNAAPNKVPENVSSSARKTIEAPTAGAKEEKKPAATSAEQMYEAELAKLESESGNINQDFTAEEIGGWEFDELENELNSGTRAIPLGSLCKENELRVKVLLGGCIPPLLGLLKSSSADSQIASAKTIYAVSQGGAKDHVGSKIFSTEGVVPVLWEQLKKGLKAGNIVDDLLTGALKNLSTSTEGFWSATVQAGGVDILVKLLNNGQPSTQANVCFLLACMMMEDSSVCSRVLAAEATKQLLKLLGPGNEASVRAEAAGALKSLSAQSKDSRKEIANSNGIPALINATIAPSKEFMQGEYAQALN